MSFEKQTLYQPRAVLRRVLEKNIPPSVPQKPKQRGGFFVLLDLGSHLGDATTPRRQDIDLIARGVAEQEPM